MEKAVQILNELRSAGLLSRYAIGGAMGALFYAEPVLTEDLDVFLHWDASPAGIITLAPIYNYLKTRGASEHREHLVIAGTLVQLIPAYDTLTEEAILQAVERKIGQTATQVMRVEHLIAIALKTGRHKDIARVSMLLSEAEVDHALLAQIIHAHQLTGKWNKFNASST